MRSLKNLISRACFANEQQTSQSKPMFESLEQRTLMSVALPASATMTPLTAPAIIATPAVAGGATTTTATTSAAYIQLGQSVTFTATVAPAALGGPVPTGTVTFTYAANGFVIGAQTVPVQANGTAQLTFTPTVQGFFGTAASYSGDTNYIASNTVLDAITNVNTGGESVTMASTGYPTALLTSQRVTAHEAVFVTNNTGTIIKGPHLINVYTFVTSGVGTLIGTVKRNLSIAPGVTKKVMVPMNLALADAVPNYFVLDAAVTEPNLTIGYGFTLNGIVVAAPFVGLSATLQGVTPATFAAKPKPFSYVLTLTNTGNEVATGLVSYAFEAFNAQYPVGTLPAAFVSAKTPPIKPGKTVKLRVHSKYVRSVDTVAGTYNLFMSATLDGVTTTAASQTPFVIS